jgi:hypothetical protein
LCRGATDTSAGGGAGIRIIPPTWRRRQVWIIDLRIVESEAKREQQVVGREPLDICLKSGSLTFVCIDYLLRIAGAAALPVPPMIENCMSSIV